MAISSPNDFSWFRKRLQNHLKNSDLKSTKQRDLIVEFILKLGRHFTLEDLHESLRQSGKNVGQATLYRTINLLQEASLIEHKALLDGNSIYEISDPDEHHDHLICLDCGKIYEFCSDLIEKEQNTVALANGLRLTGHRHDLYGRCIEGEKCPNLRRKDP